MHQIWTVAAKRARGSLRLGALTLAGSVACVLVLSASAAPPPAFAYRTLAPGFFSTCAITVAGAARCWGHKLGATESSGGASRVPVTVPGLGSGVTHLTTGSQFACAVVRGAARCWGGGPRGELGNGTKIPSSVRPVAVTGLQNGVKGIDAGSSHACAITSASGVKCWGFGILGDGSGVSHLPPGVATPVDVVGVTGVKAISVGPTRACALTAGGGVKCWGGSVLGDGSRPHGGGLLAVDVSGLTSGVKQVSAGFDHACALTASGGVKCWGHNHLGQVGTFGPSVVYALVPVDVPGLTSGVTAISAGYYHQCALMTGGAVKCWGDNNYGQVVGNGRRTPPSAPVTVAGLGTGVRAIAAGHSYSCAIDRAGITKCWGSNSGQQAGWAPTIAFGAPRAIHGQGPQRAATSGRFLTPTRNISCSLSDRPGRIRVHCQSLSRPHSVTMDGAGRLRICRGVRCLGNPAQGTATLRYGARTSVGRFQCRSQFSGVRCTVTRSGKGFLIDKTGVRPVG